MPTRDTPWPDGTPCWVDLMTTDAEAARAFYGGLFGWAIEVGDEQTGHYGMCRLGEHSVCGIGQMQMDHPPAWGTYLATSDIDATVEAAMSAGGKAISPVMDVMDFGRQAFVQDPAGAVFGLWQAKSHHGFGVANEPGAVIWDELLSRDPEAATQFYTAVFGATFQDLGGGNSMMQINGDAVASVSPMPAEVPAQVPSHWRLYFEVDDTDETVANATDSGATVLRAPYDMPFGRQADLSDPQGAMFCLIHSGANSGE